MAGRLPAAPDGGAAVIAEYRRGTPSTASGYEQVLLVVPQPYANHNGGMLTFGSDGYLHIGLWRFPFDLRTGNLWVTDVGQSTWEEIDLVSKGGNYGWRMLERAHCFHPSIDCQRPTLTQPLYEYAHEKGRCSIIGGYVYRGHILANL